MLREPAEWEALGVLNHEMESAMLFTMCAANGWRAGCASGVIVNRQAAERPDPAITAEVEAASLALVVEAARRLVA